MLRFAFVIDQNRLELPGDFIPASNMHELFKRPQNKARGVSWKHPRASISFSCRMQLRLLLYGSLPMLDTNEPPPFLKRDHPGLRWLAQSLTRPNPLENRRPQDHAHRRHIVADARLTSPAVLNDPIFVSNTARPMPALTV